MCRKGVREVQNEEILIRLLKQRLGPRFEVFTGPSAGASENPMLYHMRYFASAEILLGKWLKHTFQLENACVSCFVVPLLFWLFSGPHGAGLTNVIFAPKATVMEMPLTPQCNRCFGYLATALGNEYLAVPQVTTFYHLKYSMTRSKAEVVLQAVLDELKRKGLETWIGVAPEVDADSDDEHDEAAEQDEDGEEDLDLTLSRGTSASGADLSRPGQRSSPSMNTRWKQKAKQRSVEDTEDTQRKKQKAGKHHLKEEL